MVIHHYLSTGGKAMPTDVMLLLLFHHIPCAGPSCTRLESYHLPNSKLTRVLELAVIINGFINCCMCVFFFGDELLVFCLGLVDSCCCFVFYCLLFLFALPTFFCFLFFCFLFLDLNSIKHLSRRFQNSFISI